MRPPPLSRVVQGQWPAARGSGSPCGGPYPPSGAHKKRGRRGTNGAAVHDRPAPFPPSLLELKAPSRPSVVITPPFRHPPRRPPTRARRIWPPRSGQQWRRPRRWLPQVRGAPCQRRVGRRRRPRPSRAALRRRPRGWAGRWAIWMPPSPRARRRPPRGLAGRRRLLLLRRPAPPSQVAQPLRRRGERQPVGRARPTARR